jgi:ATP-dependent helicase HrpB
VDPRDLPIWQYHADIVSALTQGNRLVLVAATGSGKTTQVPQMLLDAGLAGTGRIVVLQPRRVAARTVATRVAWERRGRLGEEVGYQVRFEDHLGPATRICFVTEGILLRWLQDDPDLAGVAVVVFDEFHERNLLSDVALALVRELQQARRPELRMVVMSATLEAEPVARYLASPAGPAPVVVSEGRAYPVEVRWADYQDGREPWQQAAGAVEQIVANGWEGDVLVFMPGMAEINATLNELRASRLGESVALIPLHGDLSPEDQDRAFAPAPRRKIVVSTNVAETSVTIEGIRHVVDSGLARMARYDAERGLQTLLVEGISRASADQRAGRAGRTAPGTCWRLWTESAHQNRAPRNTPEIQRADLAEVVLLLHSLGIRRAATFGWLDRPEPAAVERAERLLVTLGALTPAREGEGEGQESGHDLTDVGRQMLRLPMHPRFARMLVEAARRGCVPEAALCAALVSGRDLLVRIGRDEAHLKERREGFEGSGGSDFHTLMQAFQYAKDAGFSLEACRRSGIHAQSARMVEDTHRQFLQVARREGWLGNGPGGGVGRVATEALERCLTAGFIDQLAVRRDLGTLDCDLTEGRRGVLMRESVVQSCELLVTASLREVSGRDGQRTLLGQCTAVKREWLAELFPQHFTTRLEHQYDRIHKRVAAVKVIRFLDLVIAQEHQRELDPAASGACLAEAAVRGWLELTNLDHAAQQWVARVECVRVAVPEIELPSLRGPGLQAALTRAFHGLSLGREAQQVDLAVALRAALAPEHRAFVEELAPVSVRGPEPKPLKLLYQADREKPEAPPVPEVQVKLTEWFGWKEHPRVAEGRVPVRVWLQDPTGKRLAPTQDWPAWREKEYPKVRAQLKTRHPGFLWP